MNRNEELSTAQNGDKQFSEQITMKRWTKRLWLMSMTKFMRRNIFLRILFILLVVVSLLFMVYYPRLNDLRYCFIEQSPLEHTSGDLQRLEDVLLADRKPMKGRNIFFHETSCHLPVEKLGTDSVVPSTTTAAKTQHNARLLSLNARQACAIESAALHNPNFDVFVLFASAVYRDNSTAKQPLLAALFSYPNVHMRNLNLWTYAANTPIYELIKSGALFKSKHVLSHVSDFLRYITLWRWGGTYLDLDVIVKQSLEDVPPNYSGAESPLNIAAGVMNFAPEGFGFVIAEMCLQDLLQHFNGYVWGNNGPGVITRVLNRICDTYNVQIMTRQQCRGFTVYDKEAFYAIHWTKWKHFFEEQYVNETLKKTERSMVVHVWNKYSAVIPVKVGSNVAYGRLAEAHCPKVYAACGEYF